MTNSLFPYEAVLFASYGGPYGPEDVLPFMRNATRGRNIPDARLIEVSKHYDIFGGRSPINDLNAALMASLKQELARRGVDVPVVIGNRNWHPFLAEAAEQLAARGVHRVVALATSAYRSYSSCRQYLEDLAQLDADLEIDKVGPFAESDGFVNAHARCLVQAVHAMHQKTCGRRVRVLFVTHSIPLTMNDTSGPGDEDLRYQAMHLRVAERVARVAGAELDEQIDWELVFCSRSGAPHIPWLEPDVNDRLAELVEAGVGVVTAPIGFINDHMEVAYDLDIQAAQTAAELGIDYLRAATINSDPEFVSMLADLLFEQAAIARGELTAAAHPCEYSGGSCCLPPPRRAHARPTSRQ